MGSENKVYAAFSTGNSNLNPLTQPTCDLSLANVTFEPGCRNHWHIHHAPSGAAASDIQTWAAEQKDGK